MDNDGYMQKTLILFLFGLFLVYQGSVHAADANIKALEDLVICKLKNGVRTLHVKKNEDGEWNTIYTKGIVVSVVGHGQYRKTCINVLGSVRSNLEKAGWKCRDVKEARISNLTTSEN